MSSGNGSQSWRSSIWQSVKGRFRSRVMAGLVLAVPIWLTILVVTLIFRLMRDASVWVVEGALLTSWGKAWLGQWEVSPENLAENGLAALPFLLRWGIGFASVILTIGLLYLLGAVTTNVMGRRFVSIGERAVDRLPLIKTVYRASKQVIETFGGGEAKPFQRVVLIPFPTETTRSVGFITGHTRDEQTGQEYYTVFVPTSPNPTTGYVFVMRLCDVTELDWTVEEAIQVIMSGGVLTPGTLPLNGGPTSLSQTASVVGSPVRAAALPLGGGKV